MVKKLVNFLWSLVHHPAKYAYGGRVHERGQKGIRIGSFENATLTEQTLYEDGGMIYCTELGCNWYLYYTRDTEALESWARHVNEVHNG